MKARLADTHVNPPPSKQSSITTTSTNFPTILHQSTPHGLGVRAPHSNSYSAPTLKTTQGYNRPAPSTKLAPAPHLFSCCTCDQDPQVPINQSQLTNSITNTNSTTLTHTFGGCPWRETRGDGFLFRTQTPTCHPILGKTSPLTNHTSTFSHRCNLFNWGSYHPNLHHRQPPAGLYPSRLRRVPR